MEQSDTDLREKRSDYIKHWYQREKSSRRIASVILFFTAGLIVALDKPGDNWTVLALATSIAGSVTLLLQSRHPRPEHRSLQFMKAESQATRANYAGAGAVILFLLFSARPLAIIAGIILLLLAGWFHWRANKARQFDAMFNHKTDAETYEGETIV